MSDTVIQVENLSKFYRLGLVGTGTLSHDLNRAWAKLWGKPDPTRRIDQVMSAHPSLEKSEDMTRIRQNSVSCPQISDDDYIWALKDISFEVKQGEVLGIIGRNGAGKSTLLKILSRVTAPTTGECRVKGRIASLLEVGTGFHPELTGRENIFLNGAILGMTKEEIRQKFDEIVAFAEVEKFIDTPVKRYSSGMYVRLAFAVAAHLEPEILLVDEVLAVGDAQFQKKCLGKMGNISREGRTIIFVSHNMAAVQNLCQKAILLFQGQIHSRGETDKIIDNYLQQNSESKTYTTDLISHPNRRPGSEIVLRAVRVFTNGNESTTIKMGGNLRIETSFVRNSEITNMRFGIAIENNIGQRILVFSPSHQAPKLINNSINNGKIICDIPCMQLLPGLYYITLIIGSGSADLDRIDQAVPIIVELSDVFKTGYAPESAHGVFYQEANWEVRQA